MHFCNNVKVLSPDIDRVIEVLSAVEAERQLREGKLSIYEVHPVKGITWTRRLKDCTSVTARPGSYGIHRHTSSVGSTIFSHNPTYEACFLDGDAAPDGPYRIESVADDGLGIRQW